MLLSCKKPYAPPAITNNINTTYLVVEGEINTGNDSTFIKLSRTTVLGSAFVTSPETGAKIMVEGDNNKTYPLKELGKGSYACAPLNVGNTAKYRVRIATAKNQTYLSDFVVAKDAPPIDSVNYVITAGGVKIFANAHDPANQTKNYRYEFVETWAFQTHEHAPLEAINMQIVPRVTDITDCWQNNYATDIILTSTNKLSKDVVYQLPVTTVPSTSEKFLIRYSLLLKEYALTDEAFNFWQLMKTNTENLGNIFDAQPSKPIGNIHNINNYAEPVIGYISAGVVQQKRIFIDRSQLPASWVPFDKYLTCNAEAGSTLVPLSNLYAFYNFYFLPYSAVYDQFTGALIGYTGRLRDCIDCRLKGYNHKPVFW
ncbi:MAG TPA: DUF4249 domain-containing protein [Mucilaginibacter sp.]|nr:DUF4249 domain-containing protein [Mucilaginibacter sp.]